MILAASGVGSQVRKSWQLGGQPRCRLASIRTDSRCSWGRSHTLCDKQRASHDCYTHTHIQRYTHYITVIHTLWGKVTGIPLLFHTHTHTQVYTLYYCNTHSGVRQQASHYCYTHDMTASHVVQLAKYHEEKKTRFLYLPTNLSKQCFSVRGCILKTTSSSSETKTREFLPTES